VAQLGPQERTSGRLRDIAVQDIHPNPSQPRKRFDEASLAALADSIRGRGVLQPIIVQPGPAGAYLLVAGERRWRAAKIAGIATIPALVAEPLDAGQSIELALIENVAREDLGVIEEARTIAVLIDELNITAATLARRLGRSRSDLAHTVRLLELPDEAIELIDASTLSKGHGKALLAEPDHSRPPSSPCAQLNTAGQSARSKPRSPEEQSRGADPRQRIPTSWLPPTSCTMSSPGRRDARSKHGRTMSAISSSSTRMPSTG
jgi:ParB family chromosome partitioning protein